MDELDQLREENAMLLNELESVYQQLLAEDGRRETDITYAELRQKNRQLEEKVRELEIAYTELEDAKNQLIHSERLAAMGQLGASIVHELNHPLTAISGYVQLLLMGRGDDDRYRDYLLKVKQQVESMTDLVRGILSFSRQQSFNLSEVNINNAIESALVLLERLKKHHILITKNLSSELPLVKANISQLQQIFVNLCTNAFDAMPSGGELCIQTKLMSTSEIADYWADEGIVGARPKNEFDIQPYAAFVTVSFSDTGQGIPEEIKVNIFNPFFTTKEEGKGTGLGLSICRSIIEKHHGNIGVESEVGKGTIFSIFLPVH